MLPDTLIEFERIQRQRTLRALVMTALAASVILAVFDIQFRTWVSVGASFGLALACLFIWFLNSRGRFGIAATLLTCLILAAITLNLVDGDGVHDPGLLAYPIFILVGTLLFGKRALPVLALAAVLAIATLVCLEVFRYIHPRIGPTTFGILVPMVSLLIAASAVIWVIVDNIERDLDRVRASDLELRKNYDLTLEAWAKILEYRDRETEGHSRRLVELSERLGRALGLGMEEMEQLRRGALLHDIGKLAIPDDILLKPSGLSPDEMKVIEKHTEYAKEMLSGIPFLQTAVAVAYGHHERWDGQGYPNGLAGQEIPALARIFAVVDTWDALRSARSYRRAWSADEAAAYLRQNAGIRFEPRVVEAFLTLV